MSFKIVYHLVTIVFGFLLVIQDLRKKAVDLLSIIGFLSGCALIFFNERKCCFIPFFIFLIIGILYFIVKRKQAFGSADYVIGFSVSLLLNQKNWPLFILLCGMFGVLTSLLFKSKKFPFIPSILASILLVRFL
ncbi:MAG: hypothetical protein LBI95_03110 [Holosporales bacterium]|jgi:hypothetical protein|nr:hypothetical protein [Holosporales bacterium]